MNTFRARLFGSVLLVLLGSAAAVQPAIAQKANATQKHHQTIPAGKTCSSCHKRTYAQWKDSPHGANDVQCTVCHGEITAQSVAATPALSVCDTCHAEQVAQLKSDPFMKGKTCVTCHPPHTFMPHKKTASASMRSRRGRQGVRVCLEAMSSTHCGSGMRKIFRCTECATYA